MRLQRVGDILLFSAVGLHRPIRVLNHKMKGENTHIEWQKKVRRNFGKSFFFMFAESARWLN